jgi:hypothetical protein
VPGTGGTITEQRIRFLAVAAVVSLIIGFVVLSFSAHKDSLDFSEFYGAAQMVREGSGQMLYDLGIQAQFQSRVAGVHAFYLRPPFEALFFLPFTYVSYRAAYTLWIVTNLVLLVVVAFLIQSSTGVTSAVYQFLRVRADVGLILVFFLSFAPTIGCLELGQDSILMLLVYTLAFVALRRGAEFRAGCVLACGLFKFHLIIPFILMFLLRRKWSAMKGFAAVGVLLFLVSIAVSGLGVLRAYPQLLLFDNSSGRAMGFSPEFTPNIRGLFYLLLNGKIAAHALGFLVAIFSVLTVWWSAKNWRDIDLGMSFSSCVLGTLLTSYHLYAYDLTLLLLPIAIVCGELAQRRPLSKGTTLFTSVVVIFLLPPAHFFLLRHALYALMSIPIFLLFFMVVRLNRTKLSDGVSEERFQCST